MRFSNYTAYFHDGSVINIERVGKDIDLTLESSEINPNLLQDEFVLTEENTLKGVLRLKNVKNINVAGKPVKTKLAMKYREGEILDLKIKGNKVLLLIEWSDLSIGPFVNDVSKIEIESEKICWRDLAS